MLNDNNKLICREVRIENTSVCNAKCIICPREEMTRAKVTMGNAHYFRLLYEAKDLGAESIGVFGFGEPLLDKHVVGKVYMVSQFNMESHITTNGSMLNSKMSNRLLDAGLKHMRFSVHAIDPGTYANVHRGLNWFNTVRNITHFVDINRARNYPCTTHMTVIPMHGESVEEIRKTWEPLVHFLEIWRPHGWAGAKNYRTGRQTKPTCGRPFSGPVQIQADGRVIPCCFLTNAEIVLGNTYEKSIKDILLDKPYRTLRTAHMMGRLQNYPCVNCDQLYNGAESPLLYSNRDPEKNLDTLSTSKVKI